MGRELDSARVLLAALGAALEAEGRPVARLSLQPGGSGVAYDDCCDGQGWVRVARSVPTAVFPDALLAPRGGCGPVEFAVTLEVGLIRCAAGVDDSGNPPLPEALDDDAARQLVDLDTMRDVCLAHGEDAGAYVLGEYLPVDVQGGCVGGTITVTVPV